MYTLSIACQEDTRRPPFQTIAQAFKLGGAVFQKRSYTPHAAAAGEVARIGSSKHFLRRPLASAPAGGPGVPLALAAPPAHCGSPAGAARSKVERALDKRLGIG